MVTADKTGKITMYVDGAEAFHDFPSSRSFTTPSVTSVTIPTANYAGDVVAAVTGEEGFFRLGTYDITQQPFEGYFDDLRVYGRVLDAETVSAQVFAKLVPSEEVGLVGYYTFDVGQQPGLTYSKYAATAVGSGTNGDTTGDGTADSPVRNPASEWGTQDMDGHGLQITDMSGKGNHLSGCTATAASCPAGTIFIQFIPSPVAAACPASVSPDVIHVKGGETVTVSGNAFSPSPWLTCSFSLPVSAGGGVTHVRGTYVSPSQVKCVAPAMSAATVASVEVANDGVRFTDQSVPLYYLEKALSVNATSTATVKNGTGLCAKIGGAEGYTLAAWVLGSSSVNTQGGGVLTLRGSVEQEEIQVAYHAKQFELFTGVGSTLELVQSTLGNLPGSGLKKAGWHHVALSVTGAAGGRMATLYVDGVSAAVTNALPHGPDDITHCELEIGGKYNRAGVTKHFEGLVDDVQVWGKSLDACGVRHAMWGDFDVAQRCPHAGGAVAADPRADMVARLLFDGDASDSGVNGTFPATPSAQASYVPTAVPYLPASFNRKKPYTCATTKRAYQGPGDISEPLTLPRKCDSYLTSYLADVVVPVGGLEDADVLGFGFAESQWLGCKVGDAASDGVFVSLERIQCAVAAGAVTDTVPISAINAIDTVSGVTVTQPGSGVTATASTGATASTCYSTGVLPAPEWCAAGDVTLLESVLKFDGATTYAMSPGAGLKAGAPSQATYKGFTFGAWFMPTPSASADACERGPVLCFAPTCNSVGGADNIAASVCIEYTDGRVYVTSDATGGAYDLTADTASIAAAPNQWHYAELRARSAVAPPEDGGLGSISEYFATLTVDGVTLDKDILIPARPASTSKLYVGGLGCSTSGGTPTNGTAWSPRCAAANKTDASRYFEGFVDEVRLFAGPVEVDWSRPEEADTAALAYYRFNPDSGVSQTDYYFKSNSTVMSSSSRTTGTEMSFHVTGEAAAKPPAYDYKAVPWAAALATKASPVDVPIDGGVTLTMTGRSFAASPSLTCVFISLEAPSSSSSTSVVSVAEPVTVQATFVSDSEAKCVVPELGFAGAVTVHVANAYGYAGPGVTIRLREQALRLQGGVGATTTTVKADGDVNANFTLACPAGTRVTALAFANFGTPTGRCVTATDSCTQDVTTTCPASQAANPACSADVSSSVLAKCQGLNSCTFVVNPANLGVADPCGGTPAKWLMVTATCDDSWRTQDYVMAPKASTAAASGDAYTLSMWVYPGTKDGLQAVAAFTGGSPVRNRAIVQWKPDGGASNDGMFYYYDDKINDVTMSSGVVGVAKKVARGRWYHVAVAVSSGSGALYLDGAVAATFSTTSRPDPAGSLVLGVDLDASGNPTEYFEGWLDEVTVHSRALTAAEIAGSVCYAKPPSLGLAAHFRFNDPNGEFPPVGVKNHADAASPGELVASTSSVWNSTSNTWAGQGLNGSGVAHPTYEFSGAPWFPATVLTAVASDGSAAMPLGSGSLNLDGVNFASTLAVAVGGVASTATVTSDVAASVAVSAVGSCVSGGDSTSSTLTGTNPNANANAGGVCGAPPKGWGGSDGAVARRVLPADLVRGLVCHYTFANGGLNDLSGNGNNAVIANGNAAVAAAGKDLRNDTAYSLPSTAAQISIPGCTGGKTVAAWLKVDDEAFSAAAVSSSQCSATRPADAGAVRGVWVFYAGVVQDSGNFSVYAGMTGQSLSLVSAPSAKVKALLTAMVNNREIGGSNAGGFTGVVDAVWMYSRVLCAAELTLVLESQEFALRTGPNGATVTAAVASNVQGVLSAGLAVTYYLGAQKSQAIDADFTISLADVAPPGFTGTAAATRDGWTAVKSGFLRLPGAGAYTFYVRADDAVTLKVGGSDVASSPCVSNAAANCAETTYTGTYTAAAAGDVAVELTYTDKAGAASVVVEYESTANGITRVAVPNGKLRAGTGPVTLAAWVKPAGVDGGEQTVVSLPAAGGEPGVSLGVKIGGALVAAAQVGCGAGCLSACAGNYREAVSPEGAVVADAWQHVAAAYDGVSWKLYVDGVLVATETYDAAAFPAPTTAAVIVGAETASDVVKGSPDDVRRLDGYVFSATLHAKALSGDDVAALMKCKVSGVDGASLDPSLVAYLALEEGMGGSTAVGSSTSERAASATIVKAHSGVEPWAAIPARCGGDGGKASAAMTQVAGTGLTRAKAGACTHVYVAAHNWCGGRVSMGGDAITAELIGPLHLHTSVDALSVDGGGVVDHGDGTYTVRFTPLSAGFYQLNVLVGGVKVSSNKLNVIPSEAVAAASYVVGDAAEPLKTDELTAPVPGTENTLTLVAVDGYGNRLVDPVPTSTAMAVSFSGPSATTSSVTSNGDGTYTVKYVVPTAGDYRMSLTMGGSPVCYHGGRECCDAKKSALEACSQLKVPADPVAGGCRFCLKSRDIPGAVVFKGTPAMVPYHATDWKFDHAWTISAWIKKTGPGDASGEYIAAKWQDGPTGLTPVTNPYVYLRLNRVGDGTAGIYTVAAAAVVAAGTRSVTSSQVTLSKTTWHHVAASYNGKRVSLFVDGDAVGDSADTSNTQFGSQNQQYPFMIGMNFVGAIGDVTILKTARPLNAIGHPLDRFCPAGAGGAPAADVLAVFPFDEAPRAPSASYSKNHVHKAELGYLCQSSSTSITLSCPAEQEIAELSFVNYGTSEGSCMGYSARSECQRDVAAKMDELCKGRQTCTVNNFAATFGGALTCDAGFAVALTATARCAPNATVGGDAAMWLAEDGVSHVGTFSPSKTLAGARAAVDAAAATAVAGAVLNFTVPALDACGTPTTLWNASAYSVQGSISYDSTIDVSLNHTCPSLPLRTPTGDTGVGKLRLATGDAAYCAERGGDEAGTFDVEVLAPTAGAGSLSVALTRGKVGDVDYERKTYAKSLTVAAAGADASRSVVTGSATAACEAGVPATLTVHSKDSFGNARGGLDAGLINVTVAGSRASTVSSTPVVDAARGAYTYTLTHPVAGPYTITVAVGGGAVTSVVVHCREASPRRVITFGAAEPAARFEHAAATVGPDAFIFGGVLEDKSYTDEIWKFSPGTGGKWTHRVAVTVRGLPSSGAAAVFNVVVDTASLIASGKMREDCADVRFALPEPSGAAVPHWIEPVGTPTGCGSAKAQFWVKTNAAAVHLYYGNVAAADTSTRALFAFFEDFETAAAAPAGWSLDAAAGANCGQPAGAGELATFYSSPDVSLTGARSLKAAGSTRAGGAITRTVAPAMSSFFLQAYVYDSGCAGAAWISPDWGSCSDAAVGSTKNLLPGTAVGAGVQSSADPNRYATTYPWAAAAAATRSVGWHTVAFRGNATTLEILVDGAVAKVTKGTTLSKIMLRSDPVAGANAGADFYWDGIFAAAYDPAVSASVSAEEAVLMASGMGWSRVAASAAATGPGARQGHTFVADGAGDLLVFGGERSGYEYGDVWRFATAAGTWTFLPAVGAGSPPPGRHDHSAVVHGGAMYVYGGRGAGGEALDDFWKFTLATQEWTRLPTAPGAGARFGHTAAVAGTDMLVYGGYLETAAADTAGGAGGEGEFTTELWSFDLTSTSSAAGAGWTKVGPRDRNFESDATKSVNDAIVFPSLLPPGRFSHLSLSVGVANAANNNTPVYYVLGGLDADHATPLSDAWVFDPAKREWSVAAFPASTLAAVARYDSSLATFDALGDRVLVFGGLREGAILGGDKGDTYALYLGQ